MWRSNHPVSLVGGPDPLCATFLGTPHLTSYVVEHIKAQMWRSQKCGAEQIRAAHQRNPAISAPHIQ